MKIAYITMDFPVNSETFACNDVKKLKNLGHQVDIYSLVTFNPEKRQIITDRGLENIKIYYFSTSIFKITLPVLRNYKYFFNHLSFSLLSKFSSYRQLLKHIYYAIPCIYHYEESIKYNKYDVIHFFWGHYPLILADLMLQYTTKSNVTTFLGAADLAYNLPITQKVSPKIKTVFTHSKTNIPKLMNLGIAEQNIELIYRGVDVNYLESLPVSPKSKDLWITSGRLIHSKRFDLSIKFFAEAQNNKPSLKLLIIGSGPAETDLKILVKSLRLENHIEFIPWLPHRDLLITLSKADTLLFFSEKPGEKLPNIVKEAMYFECLCFVGSQSGCDELIDNGIHGLIIDRGLTVHNVMSKYSKNDFDLMRLNAKRRIISNFSLTLAMERYLKKWNSDLNSHRPLHEFR